MTTAEPIDILILSNGPGEVTTWVKPVVAALRAQRPAPGSLRISVMLVPCLHACGGEARALRGYPEVDRVQEPAAFLPFLLTGRTPGQWDWYPRGLVLFLGGDQVYPLIIGRRLGFRTLIYAECQARWQPWIDAFGAADQALIERVPRRRRHKFSLVGDLMSDVAVDPGAAERVAQALELAPHTELLGLLPGSKRVKLTQGVPLFLAAAEYVARRRPGLRLVLPVAPTLDLEELLAYASPRHNPLVIPCGGPTVTLVRPRSADRLPYLETTAGTRILLWEPSPARALLARCTLCLTTVGANTAELGALGIPMIIVLPTHQRDFVDTWSGLPGLLTRLRLVGRPVNVLLNRMVLASIVHTGRRFAWPNLRAGEDLVPELFGALTPAAIGARICAELEHPERLAALSARLRGLWGPPGAGARLAALALRLAQGP